METKKVTQVVYIANDGKEFLTEEECKKHEAFVKEVLCNISYFCIRCRPDLTETGYYMHRIYAAVLSKKEYENCPPTKWGGGNLKSEKIFLSPKSVEGFPENIDYMKEWGFK